MFNDVCNHCVVTCCVTEQRTTPQGQVYYLQKTSGLSTWHDPRVPRDLANVNTVDLGPLPPGWLIYTNYFIFRRSFVSVVLVTVIHPKMYVGVFDLNISTFQRCVVALHALISSRPPPRDVIALDSTDTSPADCSDVF